MAEPPNAFEMRGIVKRFPGVLANDHVDFTCRAGEVHALLGENGAGKSTLMNVLAGLYRPDAGEIIVGGRQVSLRSPQDAIAHGIGMVHQHFMLVPPHSVAENMVLGLDRPRFFLNLHQVEDRVAELGEQYGMKVNPRAKIWQLSVGEQQRVEVLKMLFRGAKILIMDEPTSVLTPQEVQTLFATLRDMTKRGHTIVFISHKLDEVVAIADRVTVLRRGRVTAAAVSATGVTKAELAKLMVGREVLFQVEKGPSKPGDVVLETDRLCAINDRGLPALREVSLNVHSGEILGLAGVAGNGQRELAEVLTGMHTPTSGTIRLRQVRLGEGHQVAGAWSTAGARAGGPSRSRQHARAEHRREPDPEMLLSSAHRLRLVDRPGCSAPQRRTAGGGVSDFHPDGGHAGADALGR